tara:strand:+ start:1299 stop:1481 length:183 start_codon:yes stop_codon:yes gene_type:complete
MKILIWLEEKNLEKLHNFIEKKEDLPQDFEYFLRIPHIVEDIYVVQVILSYDEYIRLKDY